jgi:hypothetical protein
VPSGLLAFAVPYVLGWQGALRVDAALTLIILSAAAVASPGHAVALRDATRSHGRARDGLAAAWRAPAFRRWITASMIGGAAIDMILVNQVPAMIAAGLSTTTAATIGGLRGLAQLGGCIPLTEYVGVKVEADRRRPRVASGHSWMWPRSNGPPS